MTDSARFQFKFYPNFFFFQSLTDRLLSMKAWDSDLESERGQEEEEDTTYGATGRGEANGRGGNVDTQNHLQKVQKLIYAAKVFVSQCLMLNVLCRLIFRQYLNTRVLKLPIDPIPDFKIKHLCSLCWMAAHMFCLCLCVAECRPQISRWRQGQSIR